jgi:hypothetical protein
VNSQLKNVAALAALALSAGLAQADATITTDARHAASAARLQSAAGTVERSDRRDAEVGDSWLLANVRSGLGFGPESGAAINTNAYQQSWLIGDPQDFTGVRLSGSLLVSPVMGQTTPNSTLTGSGRSVVDITFALSRPTEFLLSLSATLRPDQRFSTMGNAGLIAELWGDAGSVFAFSSDVAGRNRPTTPRLDRAGVLPEGSYRLRLELWGESAWPATVSGNVDGTFFVPTPSAAMALLGLGLMVGGRKRR